MIANLSRLNNFNIDRQDIIISSPLDANLAEKITASLLLFWSHQLQQQTKDIEVTIDPPPIDDPTTLDVDESLATTEVITVIDDEQAIVSSPLGDFQIIERNLQEQRQYSISFALHTKSVTTFDLNRMV